MRYTLAVVIFVTAVSVPAQDAGTALDLAKSHLAKRRYSEAVNVLRPAIERAAAIPEADTREQALAAVHFYAAVAYSGAGEKASARTHLQEFFRFSPHARAIDASKYDAPFVSLFHELAPASSEMSPMSFAAVYARFDPQSVAMSESEPGTWGDSPAMELLASRAEKRAWTSVTSTNARETFIHEFWKRRDPTPGTPENEFLVAFRQRVAFADRLFGAGNVRGSITDRGRVFVLLGEPSSVRRRPLTRHDRISVYMEDVMINGHIEHWVYGRDQLPIRISRDKVGYRFVTQAGIGDHALQREDVFAMQALIAAANPNQK